MISIWDLPWPPRHSSVIYWGTTWPEGYRDGSNLCMSLCEPSWRALRWRNFSVPLSSALVVGQEWAEFIEFYERWKRGNILEIKNQMRETQKWWDRKQVRGREELKTRVNWGKCQYETHGVERDPWGVFWSNVWHDWKPASPYQETHCSEPSPLLTAHPLTSDGLISRWEYCYICIVPDSF